MLIGVDFDNTIVCCDQLFHQAALEKKLIPSNVSITKGKVRDYLRECGKEDAWTELQGYVYGVLIKKAPPFPGVFECLKHLKQRGIEVTIISHKTRYPFLGEAHDLHQAALDWLKHHDFFNPKGAGLSHSNVYLEITKQDKLKRISQIGCSHFIDDLPEFLMEPTFPADVERILFDPNQHHFENNHYRRANSWKEIEQWLIGVKV